MTGMQANASVWIATWGTIFQVAFYGESYLCQLASNLVVAARQQFNLYQGVSFRMTYETISQYSLLRVGYFAVVCFGCIVLLVASKPVR